MDSMNWRFSTEGSAGIYFCAYDVALISRPMTVSTHSLNFGIFCPENWYLLPEMWTDPSSFKTNSVSLNPHPLFLNHCYLFLIFYGPLISCFYKTTCNWLSLCILDFYILLNNKNCHNLNNFNFVMWIKFPF